MSGDTSVRLIDLTLIGYKKVVGEICVNYVILCDLGEIFLNCAKPKKEVR